MSKQEEAFQKLEKAFQQKQTQIYVDTILRKVQKRYQLKKVGGIKWAYILLK